MPPAASTGMSPWARANGKVAMTSAARATARRTTAAVTACSAIEPAARAASSSSPAGTAANCRSRRSSASTPTTPAATTNGATSAAIGDSATGSNSGRTSCCHGGTLAPSTRTRAPTATTSAGIEAAIATAPAPASARTPSVATGAGRRVDTARGAGDDPGGQRRKPEGSAGVQLDEHGDGRGQAGAHAEGRGGDRRPSPPRRTSSAGARRGVPQPRRPSRRGRSRRGAMRGRASRIPPRSSASVPPPNPAPRDDRAFGHARCEERRGADERCRDRARPRARGELVRRCDAEDEEEDGGRNQCGSREPRHPDAAHRAGAGQDRGRHEQGTARIGCGIELVGCRTARSRERSTHRAAAARSRRRRLPRRCRAGVVPAATTRPRGRARSPQR